MSIHPHTLQPVSRPPARWNDLSRYEVLQPQMRTGDHIGWQSKSLIGYAIQGITGSRLNHSSMVLRLSLPSNYEHLVSLIGRILTQYSAAGRIDSGCLPELQEAWEAYDHSQSERYLRSRRFVLEALEGGIVLRLLSERLKAHKGCAWWYPLKDKFAACAPGMGAWALGQVGVPYDFGSLFANILGRVSADARKFFCSEFWYMAAVNGGIKIDWPHGGKAPRPGDIDQFTCFKYPRLILDSSLDRVSR